MRDGPDFRGLFDAGTAKYGIGRLSGSYRGRKVTIHELESDDGPPPWNIIMDCRAAIEFSTLPEEAQSLEQSLKFPKKGILGFGRDDEVHDPRLDDLFAFRSTDPPAFSAWILNPNVKRSFLILASYGRYIELKEDRTLSFRITKPELLGVLDVVLTHMNQLATAVELQFPALGPAPVVKRSDKRLIAILLIGAILGALVYFLTR